MHYSFYKYLWLCLLLLILCACTSEKTDVDIDKEDKELNIILPSNFDELKAKYDTVKIETCKDYFDAVDIITQVYVEKVNKAFRGSSRAVKEMEQIEELLAEMENKADVYEAKCPDEFYQHNKEINRIIKEEQDKIIEIYTKIEFERHWQENLQAMENQIEQSLKYVKKTVYSSLDDEEEDNNNANDSLIVNENDNSGN